MADVDFVLNRAGIREVCKSGGMQVALLECAEKLADRANSEAEWHKDKLHISEFRVPPYAAHVDVLTHTAVGAAHTNGKMGQRDMERFNTLAGANH